MKPIHLTWLLTLVGAGCTLAVSDTPSAPPSKVKIVEFTDASSQHPHPPVGPDRTLGLIIEMDEIVVEQVARLADRVATGKKLGAADRKNHFLKKTIDAESGVISGSEADGDIDIVAVEIENRLRDVDPDVGPWHRCQEAI